MIAREVLDKDFGGVPHSSMNKSGHFIFHSEFIRNCQFNGWFSMPKVKNYMLMIIINIIHLV